MDRPTCPNCHKIGVQKRISNRTNRPYLANVETYDSGISYFRSLHTREECAAHLAEFEARVTEAVAREAKYEADRQKGLRAHEVLIPRYIAIVGKEQAMANWNLIAERWLP